MKKPILVKRMLFFGLSKFEGVAFVEEKTWLSLLHPLPSILPWSPRFVSSIVYLLESSPKATPSGEIVVDRVGFEPTTFWSFDLLRDPEGLQTRRSAGLIYRPTVAGLSVPRAF